MRRTFVCIFAGAALAGCTTASAPPPATPDPAAAIAASKVESAGATKIGPAGRAGWCTYQTAAGGLYEAKC